jgi:hypothetical protein
MNWKEFFANIIDSLAWPIAIIVIFLMIKDKISELIPRLKKLKHKETELEFTELISELNNERVEPNLDDQAEEPIIDDKQFLLRLSDVSKRSAVVESYRFIENAVSYGTTKLYEGRRRPLMSLNTQLKLLKDRLDDHHIKQISILKQLRNRAAHMEDFELSEMPIETYIDLALSLSDTIKSKV